MMHLTQEQLQKLQQLSNINLDAYEQGNFLQKLDPIISKLEELGSIDMSDKTSSLVGREDKAEITLRTLDFTFEGEKQKNISKNIIGNIEHDIINNSVVIKSVLK